MAGNIPPPASTRTLPITTASAMPWTGARRCAAHR